MTQEQSMIWILIYFLVACDHLELSFLEAARAVVEIGLNLKPYYDKQVYQFTVSTADVTEPI
jgi:hypothetical protein